MKNLKIVIIDSGIGGLSLLKALVLNSNITNYIYFADLKNLPYGTKTREELICLTLKNIKKIKKLYNPDAIVFGCNTIGTTIFDYIKYSFPELNMFSIRPNISKTQEEGKTLVLATTATIKALLQSDVYNKNRKCIVLCKMPQLATKVEKYIQNGVNLVPYLKNKLCKIKNISSIVLGCTHYYFVKNMLQDIFPNAKIIDGTMEVVNQIKNKFAIDNLAKNNNKIHIRWHLTANKNMLTNYKALAKNIIKNQNK